MRTIIELPDDQVDALDGLCKQQKISRAEAIRRAVAALLAAEGQRSAAEAFGLWSDGVDEGMKYQDRLRREWGTTRKR